jgi:hypothetical protein
MAIVFSVFTVSRVSAQKNTGQVTIHSDPRLALLLNRNKPAAKTIAKKKSEGSGEMANAVAEMKRPAVKTGNADETEIKSKPIAAKPAAAATLPAAKKTDVAADETERVAVSKKNNVAEKKVIANAADIKPKSEAALPGAMVKARPLNKIINNRGPVIFAGKGYRVQIYYGSDRNKANKIRTEFIRHYPGIQTYLTYNSPSFRVRVGDFRNRAEAQHVLKEANKINKPSMIVPDNIAVKAN